MQFKIIQKKSIAILFAFVMLSCITVPTVLKAIDSSIDISIVYNLSEEEEKGTKTIKEVELLYFKTLAPSIFSKTEVASFFVTYMNNYNKPHLNLISQPPENNLL